jgi:hypothetical protein
VRQHHAAAADPEARGDRRDLADHDFRAGAGQAGGAVVLGDPVAVVAEAVGQAGEVQGVAQGVAAGGALRHRRLVEHAQAEWRLW